MEKRGPKIVLISPKGPLYRHRGGIFRQNLRYMPLTFPTLKALIPPELNATVECIDEGIGDVDMNLDADLIGMTVITGTAIRAYELADHFRQRGIPVVLGGPHVTLIPDDSQPHADSIVVGYAEEEWPRLLRDFVQGQMKPRYKQAPDLNIGGYPLPDRSVLPRWRYLTADVFEATRGCTHNCSFCTVPAAWGRKPFQKPVEEIVADIRQRRAKRALFIDLNLIADKHYAARLCEALIPLNIHWFGLSTTLLCDDIPLLDLFTKSGCKGLLMGLESLSRSNLGGNHKAFNNPDNYVQVIERLHERGIALQGCFVFGLDDDTPDVFQKTAEFAVDAKIDLPRFAIVTPFPGTGLNKQLESEGRILTRNWELYDGQHVVFQPAQMTVDELQRGTETAWKFAYSWKSIARRLWHSPASWPLSLLTNLGYRYYANRLHKFYTCDTMFGVERPAPASRAREASVLEV
ncbi:MAG: B12-binding domain-containing radical SAM protein [Gemmataceae bacterium]|nr:B12-binding domain-containing radical SAM protein [Gemmataceae bacterium]